MKKITLIFSLALLFLTTIQATPGNSTHKKPGSGSTHCIVSGVFGAFHAHRQQAGIALLWNVTVNDVVDFVIERSYDGSFFEVIDHVTPQEGAWNKYRDDAALPGHIFYRIQAVQADGSFEYSDIEEVRIVKHG